MLWLGIVAGGLEAAMVGLRTNLSGETLMGLLGLGPGYFWMIPASDALIFGALGLPLAALARARSRAAGWLTPFLGIGLLSFALLLTIRRLHPIAVLLLACGLARVGSRLIRSRSRQFHRMVRWSLAPLAVATIAAGVLGAWQARKQERRAIESLPAAQAGAPNVLLIVMDTVRADRTSLNGYARDTTPNLARLAARGVRFQHARAPAPWTLPSHASLFTGRWPYELGVGLNRPLGPRPTTLAGFLARRGYATSGFVANLFFCNSWYGLGRGFAHYEDYKVTAGEVLGASGIGRLLVAYLGIKADRKDAAQVGRDALAWLDERDDERPYFIFLNFMDAHDPYILPGGVAPRFGPGPSTPEDLDTLERWSVLDAARVTRHQRSLASDAYDECIGYLDQQIGVLLNQLERRGQLRDTLIIVTSDHGEQFGEHGQFGHARSVYRPEADVPLLIVGPGVPAGRVVEEPVSLRDVPATVADLLGFAGDSRFPGASLASTWRGSSPSTGAPVTELDAATAPLDREGKPSARRSSLAVLDDALMVHIIHSDDTKELYDLRDDPCESRNLVGPETTQVPPPTEFVGAVRGPNPEHRSLR